MPKKLRLKNKEKPGKEKPLEKLSPEEFKKRILNLADKGLTAEKIGEELRKTGLHSKEYSEKISKVLKENKKYQIPDIANVEKKLEKINKHFEKNKQDKRAMREKNRIFAKLRRIKKYHKLI